MSERRRENLDAQMPRNEVLEAYVLVEELDVRAEPTPRSLTEQPTRIAAFVEGDGKGPTGIGWTGSKSGGWPLRSVVTLVVGTIITTGIFLSEAVLVAIGVLGGFLLGLVVFAGALVYAIHAKNKYNSQ